MYRCEICKNVVPSNTPMHRVTAETRPATYPHRPQVNRFVKRNNRWIRPDDPGGRGLEIQRELVVCPRCADVD